MPPQIVVVKRPRGGLFAGVRSLPHWLRAIWRDDGEALARQRSRLREDIARDLDGPDRGTSLTPVPRRPGLSRIERGASGCGSCGICIAVCPSRALARDAAIDGIPHMPLTLDLGRCIGCGLCVEACPDGALELVEIPPALWSPVSDQSLTLVLAERTQG